MAVGREDVRRIAALARLELTDEELDTLAGDMRDILAHVDALRTADLTDDDIDDAHPRHLHSPLAEAPARGGLRRDAPATDALSTDIASFAPELRDGFFTLPRLASHAEEAGPEGEGG